METLILNPIAPSYLIGAGIALIALEAVVFSFVVIWFGIASVLVGFLSYFILFNNGIWQIAVISIVALLLLFVLRTKAMANFLKPKDEEYHDNFFDEKGIGIIKNGKVYYKATYWDIEYSMEHEITENERVEVLSIKGSTAIIKKLDSHDSINSKKDSE